MISGTVTYLVRMALPPDAAIDVRLEDVSRADAPATVVAENIFAAAGKQVPFPFQLPYSAKDIRPNHPYNVRARITVNDKLLFTTTRAYPVITNGAPTSVSLVLQPVGRGPTTKSSAASAPPLRGTSWKLVDLNGNPPAQPMGNIVGDLLLSESEDRYSGSTGCNRFNGAFELSGDSLRFKTGAMTMMACPEPLMKQEQTLTTALQSVTTYRVSGTTLELLAGEKVIAKFKAQKPTQPSN
jgi:putative lipoprotein